MPDSTHHVFLSYSRADQAVAEKIRDALEAEQVPVWMDQDILPSESWPEIISTNIIKSRLVMVLISANTEGNPKQVKRELAIADKYNIPVVPVRVDNTQWKSFEFFLTTLQWFDLTSAPLDASVTDLVAEISTMYQGLVKAQPEQRQPVVQPAPASVTTAPVEKKNVTLLYKRNAKPDTELLLWLEEKLKAEGFGIFHDRHLKMGAEWFAEIERKVRESDAVIPLFSAESIHSDMLEIELKTAHEQRETRGGKPLILPVRVAFEGSLPGELATYAGSLQYFPWRSPADNEALLKSLVTAIRNPVSALSLADRSKLQNPTGAVPLDSPQYIVRPSDDKLAQAIERRESFVLIKGARQMGKTSLIARGIRQARKNGSEAAFTDFQKLNTQQMKDLKSFYCALADSLCDTFDIDELLAEKWRDAKAPNANFERFILKTILGRGEGPLLWALDEVDRLFSTDFGSEFFGLLRTWHNERSDPDSPFRRLTVLIGFATEPSLFISDANMSPFNVGLRLPLADFTIEQVAELNRRYGSPVSDADLPAFFQLLGGQPFLSRRALHEIVVNEARLADIMAQAHKDEGIFGDHLRRFYVVLMQDDGMLQAMRDFLFKGTAPTHHDFYRLRSGGLLVGDAREEAHVRCGLYEKYLRQHLA